MGAGYPFRTKRSNLIFLNVFFGLWFAGVIIGGAFAVVEAFRTHTLRNLWIPPIMLIGGAALYGIQRIVLNLHDQPCRAATETEIEDARRMLYGDKPKSGE